MTIFLDLTRISTRLLRGCPTGIDRVEFAYATHLSQEGRGSLVNVLTAPFVTGAVPAGVMREHLAKIERAWLREREAALGDPFYAAVRQALDAPIDPSRTQSLRLKRSSRRETMRKALQFPLIDIVKAPARLRSALARTAGTVPSVYFHASHTQLDKPQRFEWLRRHAIPSVFLIHDTIPVDYPEFCSPGSAARHHRRLATVSRLASVVVANSQATRRSVRAYMKGQGWRVPEIEVVPLGVDDRFAAREALPPPTGDYFVCVGTIEPRKNLIFLFNIWRELVSRFGAGAPRLVVVGRRGWENEAMLDVLERSHALAPFLVEIADLSDAGLAALIEGAVALLAPSQVEGFSLPVLEALSVGTPVVASDIEAHREVGQGLVRLASPIDGLGWLDAILRLKQERDDGVARSGSGHHFRPPSWEAHVAATQDILKRVAQGRSMAGPAFDQNTVRSK